MMRIYSIFSAVFMIVISVDEMIVPWQDGGWFPVALGMRIGYMLIVILFLGLTFWDSETTSHRDKNREKFFSRYYHLIISGLYLSCCATLVGLQCIILYRFKWLYDFNILVAFFVTLFHDFVGFRFVYALVCDIVFYLAFALVSGFWVYTGISEFLYATVGLLLVCNLSALYTSERLTKSRFALVQLLEEEIKKTNQVVYEILPQHIYTRLGKPGTLPTRQAAAAGRGGGGEVEGERG